MMRVKSKELQRREERLDRHLDESQELRSATLTVPQNEVQQRKYIEIEGQNVPFRKIDESKLLTELKLDKEVNQSHCDESKDSWLDINEVIESDFLISPGDIYPSRKVELKDGEVSEETLQRFEKLCEDQQDAFSRNNRDIGRTQLIEMEIDTGDTQNVQCTETLILLARNEKTHSETLQSVSPVFITESRTGRIGVWTF